MRSGEVVAREIKVLHGTTGYSDTRVCVLRACSERACMRIHALPTVHVLHSTGLHMQAVPTGPACCRQGAPSAYVFVCGRTQAHNMHAHDNAQLMTTLCYVAAAHSTSLLPSAYQQQPAASSLSKACTAQHVGQRTAPLLGSLLLLMPTGRGPHCSAPAQPQLSMLAPVAQSE
jgi:hypothetical protein